MNSKILTVFGLILVALVAIGGYFYPGSQLITKYVAGTPTAGSTFNTAKLAAVNAALSAAGSTGTTTSVYNGDSNDRFITDSFYECQGSGSSFNASGSSGGISALNVKAATTSTASPTNISALTNFVLNSNIATTTPADYTASTTDPVLGDVGRVWASGTYVTFFTNATNTATCQFGVHYLGT